MTRTSAAVLALLAAAPLEAHADFPRLGIFRKRNKDTKEEQPQRAKQLLETLKSDTDEKKRVAAATELREIDPRANPDVIPGVITALQRDPSPTVRGELVETLGLLKPISPTAGAALEQIYTSDPAESVRKAAQQALWQYHLNGYRPAGTAGVQSQTSEPPLARPKTAPALPATPPTPPVLKATPVAPSMTIPTPSRTTTATPTSLAPAIATPAVRPNPLPIARGVVYPQTIEPPLAKANLEANLAPIASPTPSVNPAPVSTKKPMPTPIPVVKPSKSAPVVKPMPSPIPTPMAAPTPAPMAIPIPVLDATPAPTPAPAIPFGGVPATPTPGGSLVPSIAPPSIPSAPPPASAPSIPPPKG